MNIQKPRTAAPVLSKRKHRRTISQTQLEKPKIETYHPSGQTSPQKLFASTLHTSRQTKIDCSKLVTHDIFNINGVMGNKAIMATTSPSLLNNFNSMKRAKSGLRFKRQRVQHQVETLGPVSSKDIDSTEDNLPMHYKPMTHSSVRTQRLLKTSGSEHKRLDFQAMLDDKDKTINQLRNKLVSHLLKFQILLNMNFDYFRNKEIHS